MPWASVFDNAALPLVLKGMASDTLVKRVNAALDSLLRRHRNESIAIVSHSGVIRFLIGWALSMPADQIFRLAQRHAAINRIRFTEQGPIVELING